MSDEEKIELSKKAIVHVLHRIRDESDVQFQLGAATQSFHLLTEAAAALFDEPVDRVRATFLPEYYTTSEPTTQGACNGDYGYCDAHGYH